MLSSKIIPGPKHKTGAVLKREGRIRIVGFSELSEDRRVSLCTIFDAYGVDPLTERLQDGLDLEFVDRNIPMRLLAKAANDGICDLSHAQALKTPLDFDKIQQTAHAFADLLEERREEIYDALKGYETYGTAMDEINRSIDYLRNLDVLKQYFQYQAPHIASFLPLNQPLYALVLLGIVPSMSSTAVHLRPPGAMQDVFKKLTEVIGIDQFKTLHISFEGREEFVNKTKPLVSVVLFTGSSENIQKVRKLYSSDVLFIANGSGHNPFVIGKDADLTAAVRSVMDTVLYNQGQDCAGPNTILVDKGMSDTFITMLTGELKKVESFVGAMDDKNTIVGPNTEISHTFRMAGRFVELSRHWTYGGDIHPPTGLIRPAVFVRPLEQGGNYEEFYAPVFHIQPYNDIAELRSYFLDDRYRPNAMYVSVFGEFEIRDELIQAGLHKPENIFVNSDLHKEERGYLPYGGSGKDASCIYFKGKCRPGSILPPREIHLHLVAGGL